MIDTAVSLLVFADDWGRHPSSCQHLVQRLLASHRVWWVNTIGMRPPRLDAATLRRGWEKLRQWSRPARRDTPATETNLTIVNPKMWPWFRRRHDRWINQRLLTRSLGPVVAAMPGQRVAITTIPVVADLVGRLEVNRWVYYCVDDFTVWPGLDHRAIERLERELVGKVDAIVAASPSLQAALERQRRDVRLLTHGVDLDFWQMAAAPSAGPLASYARPRVVFWGVVDRRLDTAFVRRLAETMAEGQIVLLGPAQDPDPAMLSLPQVVHAPALPLAALPSVAAQADVLVMPYRDLPVTRAMQPLKLKEYLATGKPVVASDLPATRPWQDCLDVARSPDEFAGLVCDRLRTGPTAEQLSARRRLASESWAAKAEEFRQFVVA